jgi:hypothetical protein
MGDVLTQILMGRVKPIDFIVLWSSRWELYQFDRCLYAYVERSADKSPEGIWKIYQIDVCKGIIILSMRYRGKDAGSPPWVHFLHESSKIKGAKLRTVEDAIDLLDKLRWLNP